MTAELDELRSWGLTQGERAGSGKLDAGSVPLMLDGFFNRFRLRPAAGQIRHEINRGTGEPVWLFFGFLPWWELAGAPVVPHAELAIGDTQRLRRLVQAVFRTAAKTGTLAQLTALSGAERATLLERLGVEA